MSLAWSLYRAFLCLLPFLNAGPGLDPGSFSLPRSPWRSRLEAGTVKGYLIPAYLSPI